MLCEGSQLLSLSSPAQLGPMGTPEPKLPLVNPLWMDTQRHLLPFLILKNWESGNLEFTNQHFLQLYLPVDQLKKKKIQKIFETSSPRQIILTFESAQNLQIELGNGCLCNVHFFSVIFTCYIKFSNFSSNRFVYFLLHIC